MMRSAAVLVMLPPGWIETVSETYGVPYYTNRCVSRGGVTHWRGCNPRFPGERLLLLSKRHQSGSVYAASA